MSKRPHPLNGWEGPPPAPDSAEWDDLVRLLQEHHGRRICAARRSVKSQRPHFPCEAMPVTQQGMAGGRCRMHGGTQPVGIANSNFRHGGRSRYTLTGRLGSEYRKHLDDMDYMSLRDDLAMNASLIQQQADILTASPPDPLDPELFDREDQKKRRKEIGKFDVQQMLALERYRALVLDRNRLTRTEVARVRLAEDTVSGQQVKAFSQLVLDRVRLRVNEMAQRFTLPYEAVLECLAQVQDDVWNTVAAARRSSGANDVPSEFQLSEI